MKTLGLIIVVCFLAIGATALGKGHANTIKGIGRGGNSHGLGAFHGMGSFHGMGHMGHGH
jgi:hypothetical protein